MAIPDLERTPSEMFSLQNILLLTGLYFIYSYTAEMAGNCSSIPKVTFDEVRALKDDLSVLLIDVRQPNELKDTGVIPGSINIPLGDVEDVLKNMTEDDFQKKFSRPKPSLEFPLVFSCRSGRRSASAACTAVKLGFTNVRDYSGSWLEWEQKIKQVR